MVRTQFVFRDRPVEVVWKELLLMTVEAYSDRLLVTDISTTWAEVIFWVKWIVFIQGVNQSFNVTSLVCWKWLVT